MDGCYIAPKTHLMTIEPCYIRYFELLKKINLIKIKQSPMSRLRGCLFPMNVGIPIPHRWPMLCKFVLEKHEKFMTYIYNYMLKFIHLVQ